MDCERIREDWLDDASAHAAHVASCPACAAFVAQQHALDARLARAIPPPRLSAAFRPALRARIRQENAGSWSDALPDIVHLGSCAVATAVCAVWAPLQTSTVLGAGLAVSIVSYVAVSALRLSFTELD